MAQVDPEKVINKVALRLAQKEVNNAILETQLEDVRAELARTQQELAEVRTELAKRTDG